MWLTFETGGGQGRSVEAQGTQFVLGRDASCDLVVPDDRASRRHAFLKAYPDGRAELHDMGSANGTFVNGHRITGPVLLQGGEDVQIGETVLRASLTEPSSTATQIGVVPLDLRHGGPTESTIERAKLRRSTRVATTVGVLAILAVGGAVALFATGVIGGGDDKKAPVALTTAQIVDKVRPSTVQIEAATDQGMGYGTGWVLDASQGLVVTNQHVVNDGESFKVVVGGAERDARLMGSAPCDDLAVLKVADTTGLVTLPMAANQATVHEGDKVVAVGFPGTTSKTFRLNANEGIVSVAQMTFDSEQAVDVPAYPNVIQTDAAINPGNSGGPLVNDKGELVGVNSAGITQNEQGRDIQGQNLAIGIDRVKEVVPQLSQGRSMFWTGIGIQGVPSPSDAGLSGVTDPGLLVQSVVPGSPAAKANFPKPGYIIRINDQPLTGTLQSYCSAVKQGPADAAKFTVLTGSGGQSEATVPFATTPPE